MRDVDPDLLHHKSKRDKLVGLKKVLDDLWADAIDEETDGSGKVRHQIVDTTLYTLCESIDVAIYEYEKEKKKRT